MTAVSDGPSTLEGIAPGPVTSPRYYGFRLIQDAELDFMPVRIAAGAAPVPDDLTRVAVDAIGDELFGYTNLDLTDCRMSFSDDRLYAALRNAGGGFPVNQGLTFFGYLLGIADPAEADPDTVWGMMYTFEQAGIISPGLYRIEGTGLGNLVKIGDVDVQEFPATNTLMISCLLADLLADPYFSAWYDTADPAIGVAAFTQRITLLGGAAEADRSPGGRCYLREVVLSAVVNEQPQLANPEVVGTGASAYARIEYTDANGNCPVISEIVFDGSETYPLHPTTLDYGAVVVYRSADGLAPLADGSWSTAVFRFSDNGADTVESVISATGVLEPGGDMPGALVISNAPNPFNASTTISFTLPRDMHVNICVYDANGARIATVLEGRLAAGRREVRWRARGAGGAELGSGVYFIRIEADGAALTRKCVLLR
jgi:hypothetical protein